MVGSADLLPSYPPSYPPSYSPATTPDALALPSLSSAILAILSVADRPRGLAVGRSGSSGFRRRRRNPQRLPRRHRANGRSAEPDVCKTCGLPTSEMRGDAVETGGCRGQTVPEWGTVATVVFP